VTRRLLNIATSPEAVEPADVVVLHRVVCCYPDYERLLAAAASHAQRLLVFSHPPRNVLTKMIVGCANVLQRLRGSDFARSCIRRRNDQGGAGTGALVELSTPWMVLECGGLERMAAAL
jgi:hypothetical protein